MSLKKSSKQITGIVGGQIVPATDTPLLSSASSPWAGFLLEKQTGDGQQDVFWGWHRTHVCLMTKGQLSFRIRLPRGDQDFVWGAGSVCVFPSGFDETFFSNTGSKFEAIVVELDPARLEALVGNPMAAATGTLVPQIVVRDRYIAMLLRAMSSEIGQGCTGGPLYAQALDLALATHLPVFGGDARRRESLVGFKKKPRRGGRASGLNLG